MALEQPVSEPDLAERTKAPAAVSRVRRFIQRTVRSLMMAGALLGPLGRSDAADPPMDAARMDRLVQQFDDNEYLVRDAAMKEFTAPIERYVSEFGKSPEWIRSLRKYLENPKLSMEQRFRIEGVCNASTEEVFKQDTVPTHCEMPAGPMTLQEIAVRLSDQLEYPVSFLGATDEELSEYFIVKTGSVWQVINSIQTVNGKHLVVSKSDDAGIEAILQDKRTTLTAVDGEVYATLDPLLTKVRVFFEPKAGGDQGGEWESGEISSLKNGHTAQLLINGERIRDDFLPGFIQEFRHQQWLPADVRMNVKYASPHQTMESITPRIVVLFCGPEVVPPEPIIDHRRLVFRVEK